MWMRTDVRVKGKWWYLSCALSEKRDMEAAHQFFRQALAVVGHAPERGTTDGHGTSPRAVREILGENGEHRTNN